MSSSMMNGSLENSVQCVALTYVGPYELIGGVAYLEVILELMDGSEASYLLSRPAVQSLIEGLTCAEILARS